MDNGDLQPIPHPDPLDLEGARKLAWSAALDWGFHEVAIDDPFAAEEQYKELGQKILEAIGYPEGVKYWVASDA